MMEKVFRYGWLLALPLALYLGFAEVRAGLAFEVRCAAAGGVLQGRLCLHRAAVQGVRQ